MHMQPLYIYASNLLYTPGFLFTRPSLWVTLSVAPCPSVCQSPSLIFKNYANASCQSCENVEFYRVAQIKIPQQKKV